MFNVVIFGAPGSGKGTQSEKIRDSFGLHHISTGDLLRGQIERDSELGRLANSYISKGNLIPDDLMIKILDSELDDPRATRGVIFDGFPRTVEQAKALKEMLRKRGTDVHAVVGLEVPDEELTRRLLNRGKLSGRSDDNAEAIANRLNVYHTTTRPVKDFYASEGLYRGIDGSGDIEDISNQIHSHLSAHPEAGKH